MRSLSSPGHHQRQCARLYFPAFDRERPYDDNCVRFLKRFEDRRSPTAKQAVTVCAALKRNAHERVESKRYREEPKPIFASPLRNCQTHSRDGPSLWRSSAVDQNSSAALSNTTTSINSEVLTRSRPSPGFYNPWID